MLNQEDWIKCSVLDGREMASPRTGWGTTGFRCVSHLAISAGSDMIRSGSIPTIQKVFLGGDGAHLGCFGVCLGFYEDVATFSREKPRYYPGPFNNSVDVLPADVNIYNE